MNWQIDGQWKREFVRYGKFLVVFLAYFLTAKGCQYIYYNFHTSPAVLWPPVGISFGFLYVWGYEEWIPVALAEFFVSLTSPAFLNLDLTVVTSLAYALEAFLGAYALKKMRFDGLMVHTRDALILLAVSFVFPAIAPITITITQAWMGVLAVPFWVNWSSSWAGGILSVLIITPLITTWLSFARPNIRELKPIESSLAISALLVTTYLLFWTKLPTVNSIVFIYIFLAVFFWIGLRLQPRMMMLGLTIATVVGLAGTIVVPTSASALSSRLLADELFLILIAPIFIIMSVIVTERRVAVSEYERETRELAEAMDRLSAEDRSKNEFISMLAHELRNPLAPIASTLEYLRMKDLDADNVQAVKVAEQQVRIVRRLLDDLLDVARITQKKFKVQKELASLEAIIQPAISAVASFFKSKGQHFTYSLPNETIMLRVDSVRMTQSIMNLLFNAGKYTPPGGRIELIVERENDTLSIIVRDNGVGIASEAIPLIFKPFQQASREAEVGTGLGLGLFITKQLIEMHDGTIAAASGGINHGSTMTIRMPIVSIGKKMPEPANDPSRSVIKNDRSLNILLVDDNETAALTLRRLLEMRGHEVNIAYDGKHGIEAISALKPEVVILDIGLPDMTGYDVARSIRKNGIPLTLIALTGYGQEEDLIKAQQAGFDHHLTKPVELADIEELFALMH